VKNKYHDVRFPVPLRQVVAELGVGGANPNEMFTAMVAVNQLRGLGLRPESASGDGPRSRPVRRNPAVPA